MLLASCTTGVFEGATTDTHTMCEISTRSDGEKVELKGMKDHSFRKLNYMTGMRLIVELLSALSSDRKNSI